MATQAEIDAVWNKRQRVRGYGTNGDRNHLYGRDICGTLIYYHSYGEETAMGWVIDHIKPTKKGGSDTLRNKQPMYWKTNLEKGDTYPWSC